jgi:ABC-2 type transport system permease protein
MFKLTRKASTFVLLILMILACFLLPLLMKVNQDLFVYSDSSSSDGNRPLDIQKTDFESRIVDIDAEIAALEGSIDSEMSIYQLQMEKEDAIRQIESIDLMLEYGITGTNKDGFIYDAISNLPYLRLSLDEINATPESEREAGWAEEKALLEEGIELVYSLPETKDFKAYLDYKNRSLQANTNVILGDMFDRIFTEQYDLWYQLDPSGGTDGKYDYDLVLSAFNILGDLKNELYSRISYEETMYGGMVTSLNPKKEAQLKDQVAVLEYRMENNSLVLASDAPLWNDAKVMVVGFGQFLITLLLLVIAGSAISQEIATGSIKSLIIAPVRRWKIYTAKMLSILSIGIIGIVILWVFSNIGASVFFGTNAMVPYVFVSGDTVHSIPFWLYDLLTLFAGNISTLVYCIMAFTLSIITRNTAFSVGSSVAILFTTSTVAAIISSLPIPHQLWMDFLPFMHFDLLGDFFPFRIFMTPLGSDLSYSYLNTNGPSLQFSLIYLVVLLFCMIYIGFDSFTRRDIK